MKMEISDIVIKQREYFNSGATLPVKFRKEALRKLYISVQKHESEIQAALKADLGKSSFESYMCESGMGQYHGKTGFDAFSHTKSIVHKKTFIDVNMRYQPYGKSVYGKLVRFFLK